MAHLAQSAPSDESFIDAVSVLFAEVTPTLEDIDRLLRDGFVYQSESFEIVRTPQWMLSEWVTKGWFSGDCDDVSTMAASLLLTYGYHPIKFVAIRYSHPSEFEHVFVEVDGFRIDPTVPPGTVYNALERLEFGV